MTKRTIRPHKGGRTARLDIRVTPDIKAALKQKAKDLKITVADLVEKLVQELTP